MFTPVITTQKHIDDKHLVSVVLLDCKRKFGVFFKKFSFAKLYIIINKRTCNELFGFFKY